MNINVSHYDKKDNIQFAFYSALKDVKDGDTILFENKEYHFYKDFSQKKLCHMTNTDSFKNPTKDFAILVENKNNFTIDGNGATFVIHGDMCALSLIKCNNVNLKNFTIKYNSPTNFEMTVVEKSKNKIKYSIPNNSKFCVKNNSIVFYEKSPFSNDIYYKHKNNKGAYCNVIHNGDNVYRTRISPIKTALKIKQVSDNEVLCTYLVPPNFKVNDTVAISKNQLRDNSGLFFSECSNVTSQNITVNYMHGFGWLSQMCENLTFDSIKFEPDVKNNYKVSSFADCIHICGCKGFAKINNCLFTHPHDDGINIHGAFLRLKNVVDENTAEFEFVHKQQGGYKAFFAGDKIKFYSRVNLEEFDGEYTVKNAVDDINNKTVTVTFEEKLPSFQPKLVVCDNVTFNPYVTISNCIFKAIPTRGILCTTNKPSQIFGNTFEHLKMPDIYISCDCKYWYESGPCKNMKIFNNVFSKENSVVLEPLCLAQPVKNVHENIEIYDNEVKNE